MFQLDDKFLADVGLNEMPEEQKKPFLQHIYDELELRVGTELSNGMSDSQLEEFESIIDRKDETVRAWLAKFAPDYKSDNSFLQLQKALNIDTDSPNLRAEFAATKWLEVNRPDYRDVVARVLEQLKQEITSNRDKILDEPEA
jgi:hypothetical protein